MDVNHTRYRSLVTPQDWTKADRDGALRWNGELGALTLQAFQYQFPSSTAAAALPEEPGRGGCFDAYGNLYALAADRRSVTIRSAGSGQLGTFWPVGDSAAQAGVAEVEGLAAHARADAPVAADGTFGPTQPAPGWPTLTLDALVVTTQHYLVVASAQAGGLLVFDLHGAGPPLLQPWPGMGLVQALVALPGGAIGALVGNTLQLTDASLRPCVPRVAAADPFPPPAGAHSPPRPPPADAGAPACIELAPMLPPGGQARAVLRWQERWLVLGIVAAQPGALWLGAMDDAFQPLGVVDAQPSPLAPARTLELGPLIARATVPDANAPRAPALAARAAAVATLATQASGRGSLFVLAAAGDQAYRFELGAGNAGVEVALQPEFWPLRRYEGMGLAALPDGLVLHAYPDARLFHASPGAWVPMLRLDRPRYAREAELLTPVWDAGIDGCTWHRLVLDVRLPSGTSVSIATRAVDGPTNQEDAQALIAQAPWRDEPQALAHPRGSELPWSSAEPGFATRDVLLQAARGRWFQACLRITGDGQRTPALRALRAWFPRFSYAERYLPPLFREDAASADFLERLLALFEGEFTRWEDRIAMAQWLLDARTAPAETLPWLAGWVALALDAADTDPARQRLLVRHAVTGHARRGTVPGLLLAATLAWERSPQEAWLQDPSLLARRLHGVRLQEFFGLAGLLPAGAWQPADGRAALLARLGEDASLVPGDASAGAARRGVLQAALGFVPRAAAEEAALWQAWQRDGTTATILPIDLPPPGPARDDWLAYAAASQACAALRQRWQGFLARRWRRISALNAAWGTQWGGFAQVPSPVALPPAQAGLADWHRFESQVLRREPFAHRFRVVLPLPREGTLDLDELARRRAAVQRAVQRDQPAHTVAEVRFGFDLFRIGEAQLGLDTLIEESLARRPQVAALGQRAILGRAELGHARLDTSRPAPPADRIGLDRGGPAFAP